MKIHELINEGFKEAQAAFSKFDDAATVQDTIAHYRVLSNKKQLAGDENNIDQWIKKGWPAFKQFVVTKSSSI